MKKEEIREIVSKRAEDFIKSLNGRYKDFVSDKFIQAYIVRTYVNLWSDRNYKSLPFSSSDLAYHSCIELFECLLEGECGIISNGHHVAQKFGEKFFDEPFK